MTLQDDIVEFFRATIQAHEHSDDSSWEPTRYDGARLRVISVSARIGNNALSCSAAELLKSAAIVAKGGDIKAREAMKNAADAVTDQIAGILQGSSATN